MKKLFIIFLCIFVFFSLAYSQQNPKNDLTLGSSLQNALAINPKLLSKNQELLMEREKLLQARALYLPSLETNFSLISFRNYYPVAVESNAQAPTILPASEENPYYSIRIAMQQNIYTGGRVAAINKLANAGVRKLQLEIEIIRTEILWNIKTIFNECVYYNQQIKYYEAQPRARSDAQIAYKIDMAYLNYNKRFLDLLDAIGLELNTIAEINAPFVPIIKILDLENCLVLAFQYNSKIRLSQFDQKTDMLLVNLELTRKYPTLSASVAQEWDGADSIVRDIRSWYVGINLNIPIFDGGAMFSRIRQKSIASRLNTINQSRAEDEVRLEVYKAYLDYSFYLNKVLESKLHEKRSAYSITELELIKNLNNSYYKLEYAVGVELDRY